MEVASSVGSIAVGGISLGVWTISTTAEVASVASGALLLEEAALITQVGVSISSAVAPVVFLWIGGILISIPICYGIFKGG